MNAKHLEIFLYNVAFLRKEYGLSKKEMAKILKISVKTLNKIENGEIPPRMGINITFRIFRHFHIPPAKQFSDKLSIFHGHAS